MNNFLIINYCTLLPTAKIRGHSSLCFSLIPSASVTCHLTAVCSLQYPSCIITAWNPDSRVAVWAVSRQRQRRSLHFNSECWNCAVKGWSAIHYQQQRMEADCLQEIITGHARPLFLKIFALAECCLMWMLCWPESIAVIPYWAEIHKCIGETFFFSFLGRWGTGGGLWTS